MGIAWRGSGFDLRHCSRCPPLQAQQAASVPAQLAGGGRCVWRHHGRAAATLVPAQALHHERVARQRVLTQAHGGFDGGRHALEQPGSRQPAQRAAHGQGRAGRAKEACAARHPVVRLAPAPEQSETACGTHSALLRSLDGMGSNSGRPAAQCPGWAGREAEAATPTVSGAHTPLRVRSACPRACQYDAGHGCAPRGYTTRTLVLRGGALRHAAAGERRGTQQCRALGHGRGRGGRCPQRAHDALEQR